MTWFKFSDDPAMLAAINEKKNSAEPVVSGRAFA